MESNEIVSKAAKGGSNLTKDDEMKYWSNLISKLLRIEKIIEKLNPESEKSNKR